MTENFHYFTVRKGIKNNDFQAQKDDQNNKIRTAFICDQNNDVSMN